MVSIPSLAATLAPPRSCPNPFPRSALPPRCVCQVSSSLSTPARLPFFSDLPSESTPGHRQSLSPGFALLSPVAEALLKSAAKAASALQTDACDSNVRVSQPDADDRAQLKELQKLIENASIDALNILGEDASVAALNIDAPAFCPITTMAPPPPRMLAAAATTALKDAADDDSAPMLRVAAAEFVPSRGPSRSASPQHLRAPEAAALPGPLRDVCPLPMPPPVGTEVLRAQLLRLCQENERAKARHAELQAHETNAPP